jgi:2-polyprenyl-3-methyl-5-hydroxy-6-metoxy-1,4-benzoquinol methylase
MDLKESEILGDQVNSHWYYTAKAKALRCMLAAIKPRHVLDVGAGSGFFSRHLLANSGAETALCIDPNYPGDSDEFVDNKPLHFRTRLASIDADLVLLMDVLEHVDDDVGLLREYIDKVPAGAYFFISVPAFRFLWSGHDDFLEHKRRYTLAEVETLASKAGLAVVQSNYYFLAVFPIAATLRLLQRLTGSNQIKKSQ